MGVVDEIYASITDEEAYARLPGALAAATQARGAILITPPLKIENGSGSPLRVLALIAD